MMKNRVICFLIVLLPVQALAYDLGAPERRKPQFETSQGYAIFPFPYSLPGIGSGLSLVGGATNIAGSYVDAYGMLLGGEVTGTAVGVDDIHLVPRRLILELGSSIISTATITNYGKRGMASSQDEYNLIEVADATATGGRLTATFFDRRVEVYGAYYKFSSRLEGIRNSDGEVILKVEDPETETADQKIFGMLLDFTDDYQDPRTGVRLGTSGWYTPAEDSGPEYLLLDNNLTAYLPMGKRSTWAFNYFQSDAVVFTRGETDRETIIDQLGLDCSTITDADQQDLCNQLIDNRIAQNSYGTASSLGGFSRLRSYSQGRYYGAHTRFLATEFRWNLTDEFTPFDLYIIKDIRTSVQTAFFFEIGTIADLMSDLGDDYRSTYGLGLRIITASGAVFRGDFAYGDEGFQPNVFIGYPWEI